MHAKLRLAILAAALFFNSQSGFAAGASEASTASAAASVLIGATGSAALANGSGRFVVTALETAGESTTVFLRDASTAAEASVRLAGGALSAASVGVGSVLTVAIDASGQALMASGKVIAFIPNEIGRALLGSARTRDRQ